MNEEITVKYFEKWKWISDKWLHKYKKTKPTPPQRKPDPKGAMEKKEKISKTPKHSGNGSNDYLLMWGALQNKIQQSLKRTQTTHNISTKLRIILYTHIHIYYKIYIINIYVLNA